MSLSPNSLTLLFFYYLQGNKHPTSVCPGAEMFDGKTEPKSDKRPEKMTGKKDFQFNL